jgi:RNA polymerase sigma-70 factor (ECF subfamily)
LKPTGVILSKLGGVKPYPKGRTMGGISAVIDLFSPTKLFFLSVLSILKECNPNPTGQKNMVTAIDQGDFQRRLDCARGGDSQALGQLLQWYANYLTILANTQLDRRIRQRVSPSDIVQDVMLAAHRDFPDFRGHSPGELLNWIRRILINTLHRSIATHVKAGKRDVRREVSMESISQKLDRSAAQLLALLPDKVKSPSHCVSAAEESMRLVAELNRLRPQYRDVIVYRVMQGLSFDEIALLMDKTSAAVRIMWLRALDAFRLQGAGLQDGAIHHRLTGREVTTKDVAGAGLNGAGLNGTNREA